MYQVPRAGADAHNDIMLITLFSRQIFLNWYILCAVILQNTLLTDKCLASPTQ